MLPGNENVGPVSVWQRARRIFAGIFVHLFPRPAQAKWGWARIGWSWSMWWSCVGRCLENIEPRAAFGILTNVLVMLEERTEGMLFSTDPWGELGRVMQLRERLCSYANVSDDALDALLAPINLVISPGSLMAAAGAVAADAADEVDTSAAL